MVHSGKLEDAYPLWEAARTGREKLLGPGHPDTIVLSYNQAIRLNNLGKCDISTQTFEENFCRMQAR